MGFFGRLWKAIDELAEGYSDDDDPHSLTNAEFRDYENQRAISTSFSAMRDRLRQKRWHDEMMAELRRIRR